MPKRFEVLKSVDAYIKYSTVIEAESAQAALDEAQRNEDQYTWKREYETEFDDTEFFEDEVAELTDDKQEEATPLSLYFVDGEIDENYNCSAFIRAHSPKEAFELWKASSIAEYALIHFADTLSVNPVTEAGENDLRVFLVPDNHAHGIIDWNTSEGVKVVAFAAGV